MERRYLAMITAVLFAGVLAAGEFWQAKQPSEWNEKEISRMLTRSPWAKEVSVQSNMRGGGGGGPMGGSRGGGSRGGMGGPGMGGPGMGGPGMEGPGMGEPGMGGAGGGMPMAKVLVRWDSAKPVQEAMVKAEVAAPVKARSEGFYIVTVIGFPMMNRRSDSDRMQADPERMKERLIQVTSLQRKNKDAIQATDAEFVRSGSGTTIRFFFPREKAIQPGDKEVTFRTQMGPMEIQAKFALKEMVYGGKLEL